MVDEGRLILGARLVTERTRGVKFKSRRRIEVFVRDDGQGMSEETLRNLFIPFFTTKKHGTGLGLPISQRILQHHGGTILVESPAGGGTEMRFRLFLSEDAALLDEERRLNSGEED